LIWGRRRQTGHVDQPSAQQMNDAPLPLWVDVLKEPF
jgi:hypothetical protein